MQLGFGETQAPVLRDYQHRAIEMLGASFKRGKRAPILVCPTGAGKTLIASELIRRCVEKGHRAMFLAPRRELIFQTSRKLSDIGVPHGVILAGEEQAYSCIAPVQVASIPTLASRVKRNRADIGDFDLIFVDEVHLAITQRQCDLLDRWPNAFRVGLTATPTRKDGRALGAMFDDMVEPVTVKQLTEQGYLAPARYFSVAEPDLRGIKIQAGDYNAKQLEQLMNRPVLVGDIVQHWLEHARTRRTVVFATSIKHSQALAQEFQRAGVAAEHVDANTPEDERRAVFARFTAGTTEILTNCFLASYGFDLPALSCVVLARPTKSLMLYLQMLGRGLRICDGKADALVLDHAGNVHRHGFVDEERYWTLDGNHKLAEADGATPHDAPDEPKAIKCPECSAMFKFTRTCPECGFTLAAMAEAVPVLPGRLVEIGKVKPEEASVDVRRRHYLELAGMAQEHAWKAGWAAHKFKEAYGQWPPAAWKRMAPLAPSLATRRWVESQQRKWLKARRAEEVERELAEAAAAGEQRPQDTDAEVPFDAPAVSGEEIARRLNEAYERKGAAA